MTSSMEIKEKAANKTIWFIGGTGLIGRHLITALCQRGHHIISLARRPSGPTHPMLSEFHIDFEALTEQGHATLPELPKPDALISTLGTTLKKAGSKTAFHHVDHDYVAAFAKAGHSKGAQHMLMVSSIGANRHANGFYLRVKGECEETIRSFGFPRLDIFRPGLLLGAREEYRRGEHLASLIVPLINPILPKSYRAIQSNDVAKAMSHMLTHSAAGVHIHHNKEIWENIA